MQENGGVQNLKTLANGPRLPVNEREVLRILANYFQNGDSEIAEKAEKVGVKDFLDPMYEVDVQYTRKYGLHRSKYTPAAQLLLAELARITTGTMIINLLRFFSKHAARPEDIDTRSSCTCVFEIPSGSNTWLNCLTCCLRVSIAASTRTLITPVMVESGDQGNSGLVVFSEAHPLLDLGIDRCPSQILVNSTSLVA
jgi:hypothetical protein